jgi:hypothetical protein
VDDPASLDAELLRELMLEMIRAGAISDDMVASVQRRFEGEARFHEGTSREDRYRQLAHMAGLLPIEAQAMPSNDFDAARRRRQLRIVTPDGGNDPL